MDRVRRQSEIAEAAANENKDSNEIKLRENFQIQKMWSQFYKKKMNNEMKKSHQIEEAFQDIRTATGVSDVQDIVQKFLTKEQTYAQLLRAVSENERRLDNLRKETEEKRHILHRLQIELNTFNNSQQVLQKSQSTSEIQDLHKHIEILEREVQQNQERRKKIHMVTDKVSGWGNRVYNKLNTQLLGSDITPQSKKLPIISLFNSITEIVCNQLEEIINQHDQEDHQTGYITAKDFMNDFATEEFLTKNIRVRPVSGITGKDDDRQSEHISRANLFENGNGDDEEKFNKMVNLEMEDQRKKIKVQREEIERRKQLQQDKLDKVNAKKKQ